MSLISDEDLQYIENFAKSQREWNIDIEIKRLKHKWNDQDYFYDEEEARKILLFTGKLKLDKGKKGEFCRLLKFQFEIITEILCVKNKKTGFRRHRLCFLDIARKNGKGILVALIMIYLYFTDKTFGAQYIICANSKKQASELFNTINIIIKQNRTLVKNVKRTESTKEMYRKSTNSYLRVLSNEGGNLDSYPAYCYCLDEIHEYKDMSAYEKLSGSTSTTDEPLAFLTTTASNGRDLENFEYVYYQMSKDVEQGKTAIKDDTFYSKIYEGAKDCDLLDVKEICNANPAIGNFKRINDVIQQVISAKNIKSQEAGVRRYQFNQHVSLANENAIDMDLYRECTKHITLDQLRGQICWAAIDLSYSKDITAYVQVFYNEDLDKFIVYPHLFTPKNTLKERCERDEVRYDDYIKNGDLITLEGNHVSFPEMVDYINTMNKKYDILTEEIAYDPYLSGGVVPLMEDDYTMFVFGQNFQNMTPAIMDFDNLMLDKRIIFTDNKMLDWMASNVITIESPSNGNIKYDKQTGRYKIDGIIATVMAIARARYNNQYSYSAIDALEKMDW